jgi:hypothetical protein
MALLQLDPPIPVEVIGRGKGLAHILIDYGPEYDDLLWVVILNDTREIWTFSNSAVRGQTNITMGRPAPQRGKRK